MKVVQQICNRQERDEGRIQETGPSAAVFTHLQTKHAKRLVLARMQDADAPCEAGSCRRTGRSHDF